MAHFVNKYSAVEKTLHNIAFGSLSVQAMVSKLESQIYNNKLTEIKNNKPVFITALPRAGTTLLLELSVETNEFASHTYRNMPFLFTPIFWSHFSKYFMHADIPRERAHGDGMMISVDSPEAFEEIIWKYFWSSRYKKSKIIPWPELDYPDFENFIHDHIKKLIFLKEDNPTSEVRYISKNNLNIARISYLNRVFPDSIIIVPFRDPLQHASSLLRQHLNFQKIHNEDSFASKYMKDIGHFDFAENLRPVDFDNWLSSEQIADPGTLTFWLQYWIYTYKYLLSNVDKKIHFISFDLFCDNPEDNLLRFGKILEIKNINNLMKHVDRISAPKPYTVNTDNIPSDLLKQVEELYIVLQKLSFSK